MIRFNNKVGFGVKRHRGDKQQTGITDSKVLVKEINDKMRSEQIMKMKKAYPTHLNMQHFAANFSRYKDVAQNEEFLERKARIYAMLEA